MVFLPVKLLGPFAHVHEGKSKRLKQCRPELDGVLLYDMKQKYFVSDMKYFAVMDIYFFMHNVLGAETFILCSNKIKVSPRNTWHMKK